MEILTVKNNKMDYSTFKKIIILFDYYGVADQ